MGAPHCLPAVTHTSAFSNDGLTSLTYKQVQSQMPGQASKTLLCQAPPICQPSGAKAVSNFPTSKNIQDLEPTFGTKVQKFIHALKAAGAKVNITATERPSERSDMIHWAWMIAKQNYDARKVPPMKGAGCINWWHGDHAKSKAAAQAMVDAFGINKLKTAPAEGGKSNHNKRNRYDYFMEWRSDDK